MSANIAFVEDGLTWFRDSPNVGHPDCRCSACMDVIRRGIPLRMFRDDANDPAAMIEARFCQACQRAITGVLHMPAMSDEEEDL